MAIRLEHANICVHDTDGTVRPLLTLFPDFRVRQVSADRVNVRSVHVGTDEASLALRQANPENEKRGRPYSARPGLNHLGCAVDNVEAVGEPDGHCNIVWVLQDDDVA